MTERLEKLNCMNYQVDTDEGHYYLCCGLRSLWRFSKHHKTPFKALCETLLEKAYLCLDDEEQTQISMI